MRSRASYPYLLKTLFNDFLNTCLSRQFAPTRCMCSALYLTHSDVARHLCASRHLPGDSNCVTQSISLSNIRSRRSEPSPEAHETCSRPFVPGANLLLACCQFSWQQAGNSLLSRMCLGGADRDRTGDLMLAKHALSQLSYSPTLAASFWPLAGTYERPTSASAQVLLAAG